MDAAAREKILQSFGRGTEVVEIPEVGVSVSVRSLGALELLEYHQKRSQLRPTELVAWLLGRCVDGMSEEDFAALGPRGAPLVLRLLEVANRVNGLVLAAAEETRGN